MTKEEVLFLRSMLLDRRSSILERVQKLAAAWQELEERAIELEEEAQKASIAKPYDQLDTNGKSEIEQIDLALTKITVGEYGICESCGEDIGPKRLEAIPWTRLCVECARDYEKRREILPQSTEVIGTARIPDEYQGLTNDQIVNAIYELLQADERIDTDELKIAIHRGVVYLDGSVPGEIEHDIIMQSLTDTMGFSAIVDRLEVSEFIRDREAYGNTFAEETDPGDRRLHNRGNFQDNMYEAQEARPSYAEMDSSYFE